MIRLEIEAIEFTINGITDKQRINIMDLGESDIFIGHNWLARHNPMIDWKQQKLQGRTPAIKVANVRRSEPKIQCTPRGGWIGEISPQRIARIHAKDPSKIGVIWIRKVAARTALEPKLLE